MSTWRRELEEPASSTDHAFLRQAKFWWSVRNECPPGMRFHVTSTAAMLWEAARMKALAERPAKADTPS